LHDILLLPNVTFIIRWFTLQTEVRYYVEVQLSQPKGRRTNIPKDLGLLLGCNADNLRDEVAWMLTSGNNMSSSHGELGFDLACIANRSSKLSVEPLTGYPHLDKYQCTQGIDNQHWSQWEDALTFAKTRLTFATPVWPRRLTYDELIAIWSSVLGALLSGVLAAVAVFVYAVLKCCWVAVEPGIDHLAHTREGRKLGIAEMKRVDRELNPQPQWQTRQPSEMGVRGFPGPNIARERLTGNPQMTLVEY
jgi:hypothetical protein